MGYTNTLMYIFMIIPFFFQQQTLFAMSEIVKPKELKNHNLKIKNHENNSCTIIAPELTKVFQTGQSCLLSVAIDAETVAFLTNLNTIKITHIKTGQCLYSFTYKKSGINTFQKITDTSIALGCLSGKLIIWFFKDNTQKKFKNHSNPIYRIVKMTKKNVIAAHDDGIIEVFDIKREICLKTTFLKPFIFLERLSNTKIMSGDNEEDFITISDIDTETEGTICFTEKSEVCKNSCLLKNSQEQSALCYKKPETKNMGSIHFFDLNLYKQTQKVDVNTTPIFMLNIPAKKALLLLDNAYTISLWKLENPAIKVQSIFCFDFLEKNNDTFSSITYLEKEEKIMAITKKGYVITFCCKTKK